MLTNHKLLIDKHCPMCNIYGKCFTKIKLVDAQTVSPYQNTRENYAQNIDMERAKNEIALYNIDSTQTIYGIDAMIKIVSHQRPRLHKLLHSTIVYAFLLRLYRFISYNRKVIYPTAPKNNERDCTPQVNTKYRWFYILFVAIFTGIVLNNFIFYINMALDLPHNWVREYIVCFGQIAWQFIAISLLSRTKTLDYLGNMSTVSMIGGLLLLPLLAVNLFTPLSPIIFVCYFFLVVSIMLVEHIRRCKLLGVSLKMTGSWILYRITVLAVIVGILMY